MDPTSQDITGYHGFRTPMPLIPSPTNPNPLVNSHLSLSHTGLTSGHFTLPSPLFAPFPLSPFAPYPTYPHEASSLFPPPSSSSLQSAAHMLHHESLFSPPTGHFAPSIWSAAFPPLAPSTNFPPLNLGPIPQQRQPTTASNSILPQISVVTTPTALTQCDTRKLSSEKCPSPGSDASHKRKASGIGDSSKEKHHSSSNSNRCNKHTSVTDAGKPLDLCVQTNTSKRPVGIAVARQRNKDSQISPVVSTNTSCHNEGKNADISCPADTCPITDPSKTESNSQGLLKPVHQECHVKFNLEKQNLLSQGNFDPFSVDNTSLNSSSKTNSDLNHKSDAVSDFISSSKLNLVVDVVDCPESRSVKDVSPLPSVEASENSENSNVPLLKLFCGQEEEDEEGNEEKRNEISRRRQSFPPPDEGSIPLKKRIRRFSSLDTQVQAVETVQNESQLVSLQQAESNTNNQAQQNSPMHNQGEPEASPTSNCNLSRTTTSTVNNTITTTSSNSSPNINTDTNTNTNTNTTTNTTTTTATATTTASSITSNSSSNLNSNGIGNANINDSASSATNNSSGSSSTICEVKETPHSQPPIKVLLKTSPKDRELGSCSSSSRHHKKKKKKKHKKHRPSVDHFEFVEGEEGPVGPLEIGKHKKKKSLPIERQQAPIQQAPVDTSVENPWFALRRSERIFFAHEFGNRYSISEKESSNSNEARKNNDKVSSDDSQFQPGKEALSDASEKEDEDEDEEVKSIEKSNAPMNCESPKQSESVNDEKVYSQKQHKHHKKHKKHKHKRRELIRRSLDDASPADSGQVFCWEFEGSPTKKSYCSPKGANSSGSARVKSIRKDFFTCVKRTRVPRSGSVDGSIDEMKLKVGDCALFCSADADPSREGEGGQLPFIGRIDSFWREIKLNANGQEKTTNPEYNLRSREDCEKMMVKVRWFYHAAEAVTKDASKQPMKVLLHPEKALFESTTHCDENDVQTISCKCTVLPFAEFKTTDKKNKKVYYLAGKYEPLSRTVTYEAAVPFKPKKNT